MTWPRKGTRARSSEGEGLGEGEEETEEEEEEEKEGEARSEKKLVRFDRLDELIHVLIILLETHTQGHEEDVIHGVEGL